MYYVSQVLYYQLNIDYIVETYCVNKEKPTLQCNGKCHLAKQLQPTSNTSNSDDAISSLVEAFTFVYYNDYPSLIFNTVFLLESREKSFFYTKNYTYKFEYSHFRPPTV
ncbi:hypothetical protein Q4512_14660 [Oceanihabitans sp. 2_MG-2023]|nr:hypothetical protein [Oceanihabitans sp. 2_MG-2023]